MLFITRYDKRSNPCTLHPTLDRHSEPASWGVVFQLAAAAVSGVHWEPYLFLMGTIRTSVIFNDLIHLAGCPHLFFFFWTTHY